MKIVYKVSGSWFRTIEYGEVIEETKALYRIKAVPYGSRCAWRKDSVYETFEDAKRGLIDLITYDIGRAEKEVERIKCMLESAKNLKEVWHEAH